MLVENSKDPGQGGSKIVYQGSVHRTEDRTGLNRGPRFGPVHFSEKVSNRDRGSVIG